MESEVAGLVLGVCRVLDRHHVQYLIVGGMAVSLHGYFRLSINSAGAATAKSDLDFWYQPSYQNYFRLLDALEELGQDVAAFRAEQAPDPRKSFFRHEFALFTLDFLPAIKAAIRFETAFANRQVVTLDGVALSFIGYDDLLRDKQTNARPKDAADVSHLKNKPETS